MLYERDKHTQTIEEHNAERRALWLHRFYHLRIRCPRCSHGSLVRYSPPRFRVRNGLPEEELRCININCDWRGSILA